METVLVSVGPALRRTDVRLTVQCPSRPTRVLAAVRPIKTERELDSISTAIRSTHSTFCLLVTQSASLNSTDCSLTQAKFENDCSQCQEPAGKQLLSANPEVSCSDLSAEARPQTAAASPAGAARGGAAAAAAGSSDA